MTKDHTEQWRAEQHTKTAWRVVAKIGDMHERVIAENLDERIARLIAAAPANKKLCEELADALEHIRDTLGGRELPDKHKELEWAIQDPALDRLLAKAGRAPG